MTESSDYTEYTDYSTYSEYTDHPRQKICFAILVHNRREVIFDLLDNIRCYCPNSSVVLYNGGDDPELCKGLGYPVCPTSRKLYYGVTAIYMVEVMEWLEDINYSYDVLINLDSDVLFAREGFEQYILNEMKDKDYLGVDTKIPDDDFYCLVQLRQEINRWLPLLGNEPYRESFNVGQVYSRKLVLHLLHDDQYELLKSNLRDTRAFGVDELVFATIVERLGYKLHAYREDVSSTIRYRPHFPLDEMISLMNSQPECSLIHPVYRNLKDESRSFIREVMKRKIQLDPDHQERFMEEYLGEMPYLIRRSKYNGAKIEWLAASEEEGVLYWRENQSGRTKDVLFGPYAFGSGKIKGLIALESRFGNLEAVCRSGYGLVHYWRDEHSGEWFQSEQFAEGVTGMPAFLESSYGNFEVVTPLKEGRLGHWWRNNDDPTQPWFGPEVFGTEQYDEVILVENDAKQLTAIASKDGKYQYYVRDDHNSWEWYGPYD
ncbi:hypothetical protein [Paenibacillus sp.]|uniref:hypothetical protein n=1 Tax=Paenibacillus sp. TaxID=58172 RepID=UPI0028A89CBF|nr:hypothetical protein [Paenibacillus sp.]